MSKRLTILTVTLFFTTFIPLWHSLLSYGYLSYSDFRAFTQSWFPPDRYISAWQFEGLGNAEARTPGELIVSMIVLASGSFSAIAQKILFFSLLPLSGLAMSALLREFRPKLSVLCTIVGGLVYAINPVSLQEFAGGALGGLWEYMLIPFVILYLNRFVSSSKFRDLLRSVLCLAAASIFLVHAAIFVVGILVVSFLGTYVVFRRDRVATLKSASVILSVVILYPLLLAPAFIPLIVGYGSSIGYASNAMPTVQYTYVAASFTNSLRLIAIGWPGAPLQDLGYMATTPQGLVTWLLPILALTGCLLGLRVKGYSRICVSLLLVIFLGALFDELTRDRLTYPLFNALPILYQYESPTKLAYVQTFAYAPAIAILGDRVVKYTKSFHSRIPRNTLKMLFVLLTISMISVYSLPFMNGYGGINNVYGHGFYVRGDYFQTSRIIDTYRGPSSFFRTLWLPLDYSMYLESGAVDSYTFSIPSSSDIRGPNYPATNAVGETFDLIANNNLSAAAEQLGMASVRFVLIDMASNYRQSPQKIGQYWLVGDPHVFFNRFMNASSFHLLTTVGQLAIFENLNYLPLLFLTQENANTTLTSKTVQGVSYTSLGPEHFQVRLPPETEGNLYFAMSYHQDWRASSGQYTLEHQRIGWANAFSIQKNDTVVDLVFTGQTQRNVLLSVQTASVLASILAITIPAYKLQAGRDEAVAFVHRAKRMLLKSFSTRQADQNLRLIRSNQPPDSGTGPIT